MGSTDMIYFLSLCFFFLYVGMLQTQGEYDETTSEDEKAHEGACATVSLSVLFTSPTHIIQ